MNLKTKLKITAALMAYCLMFPLHVYGSKWLDRKLTQVFAPEFLPALKNLEAGGNQPPAQTAAQKSPSE